METQAVGTEVTPTVIRFPAGLYQWLRHERLASGRSQTLIVVQAVERERERLERERSAGGTG